MKRRKTPLELIFDLIVWGLVLALFCVAVLIVGAALGALLGFIFAFTLFAELLGRWKNREQ